VGYYSGGHCPAPFEINVNYVIPLLLSQVPSMFRKTKNAGIAEHDVYSAELLYGLPSRTLHRVKAADVGHYLDRAPSTLRHQLCGLAQIARGTQRVRDCVYLIRYVY
jgi:hypothetical protein